ncbi:hypothetical protein [Endozoicomonas sp. ALC020]|uniref:hypothetical protein n=1 Tax=unclassified Endozoicomonas TaxID=2644528 RepID=UPI003BB04FCF
MLKQRNQPFATITTMYGSAHNPPQYPSSEATGQQAPQATNNPTGYFTHRLYSDSGNGNEDPEQNSHTLGLNCFIHPCHGVCRFRPAFHSSEPAECPLNSEKKSTDHIEAAPGQSSRPHFSNSHCLSCKSDFDSLKATDSRQIPPVDTLNDLSPSQYQQASCQPFQPDEAGMPENLPATSADMIIIDGLLNLRKQPPLEDARNSLTINNSSTPIGTSEIQQTTGSSQPGQNLPLSRTATKQTSDRSGQQTCGLTTIGQDGQPQLCGSVCKNARALSSHKSGIHRVQQTCHLTVLGEDGQQRSCGKICTNAQALSAHKRKSHTGEQFCDVTMVGQDGQLQPCGEVCENAQALSSHKSNIHCGQKTCDVIVDGQDGQPQPCGKVCKHAKNLSDHKRKDHSGQQTCDVTLVGPDGQLRPCGVVCKNAKNLSCHKSGIHRVQQTCHFTEVGEDGQQQPCGKVCRNARALMYHKRKEHTGQHACHLTVVGKDGQQRPCGKLCKTAKALSDHKRIHRKRRPANRDPDNDLSKAAK